jgi:hypothetical protein
MHIKIELEHFDARLKAEIDTDSGNASGDPTIRAKDVGCEAFRQLIDQVMRLHAMPSEPSFREGTSKEWPPRR